ncbi:MAG: hypothetical protein KGL39_22855 [Patescibacteria group bacterium]|nr:hypothetical protein [Patescibacteria group bacterium]
MLKQSFACDLPPAQVKKIRAEAIRLQRTIDGTMLAISTYFFMLPALERAKLVDKLNIPKKTMGRKIK